MSCLCPKLLRIPCSVEGVVSDAAWLRYCRFIEFLASSDTGFGER